jgi:hypothetical protein
MCVLQQKIKKQVRFVIYIAVIIILTTIIMQSSQNRTPSLCFNWNTDTFSSRFLHSNDNHFRNKSRLAKRLPPRVIKRIKQFVFFVGLAQSGESVIASMLDAHPNVIIAHEYSLFSKWLEAPELHSNKSSLFNSLYEDSRYNGLRMKNTRTRKKLIIPNWWQGNYENAVHVIGNKAGEMTAQMYRRDHGAFRTIYRELKTMLNGVPISVIYGLRNPFDNIASMLLYNHHQQNNVNETHKYMDDKALRTQIIDYFNQVQSVTDMITKFQMDIVEVHNIDMITDPKETMQKVCSHLHLICPDKFLHMCAQITYPTESKSRRLVRWTGENIGIVARNLLRFDSLKRYTF